MKQLLFHLGFLTFYVLAWGRLHKSNVDGPSIDPKLDRMQKLRGRFLTNWNFGMQTLFLLVNVVFDIVRLLNVLGNRRNSFKKRLDFFFYSIVGPTSIFVCIAFWGLYLIDRNLIFPPILDKIIPAWVNHALHSFIVVVVAVQMVFNKQPSPSLRDILIAQTALNVVYLICVYETHYEMNLWIYPFLEVFHEPFRFLVLVFLFLVSVVNTFAFYYVNNALYGKPEKQASAVSKKTSDKKKTSNKNK